MILKGVLSKTFTIPSKSGIPARIMAIRTLSALLARYDALRRTMYILNYGGFGTIDFFNSRRLWALPFTSLAITCRRRYNDDLYMTSLGLDTSLCLQTHQSSNSLENLLLFTCGALHR